MSLFVSPFAYALAVHVIAGCVVITVGVMPMLTRKGGRLHRISGRVFAGFMAMVLTTAWIMTALRPDPFLLGLSAAASLTLFSGLRVLGRKHHADRARPLDVVMTVLLVAAGCTPLVLALNGATDMRPAIGVALAYGAVSVGGWDLWRFARPTDWPFSPRLWMYEHLWKMVGAYSAALSAFAGNFLTFIPAPWSALWPTILFQIVTVFWIARHVLDQRRPPRALA